MTVIYWLSSEHLIRLQRIYNFWFFHAIILSILDVLYAFICYFISFFVTNLLTQCLVSVAIFCLFLIFQKISTKRSPNAMKLFDKKFWTKETLEASGGDQRMYEETARRPGAPRGRPVALWAPRGSVWPNSTSINSQILGNQQRATRKTFYAPASLCSDGRQSGDLFWWCAGGGIDHGGHLYQPCCLHDDAWVAHHRPTGP